MSQVEVFKPNQTDCNLEDFQLLLIQMSSDLSRGFCLSSARRVLLASVELLLVRIHPTECTFRLLSLQASFISHH